MYNITQKFESEKQWIDTAKAEAAKVNGKIRTNHGHGTGTCPVGPSISVTDNSGKVVCEIVWDRT